MAARTVAVVGGGTGGLVAAHRLRRELTDDRVVLVDRDPIHAFAPSLLWVMSGARRPEQITRDRTRIRRRGIEVLIADVKGIDAEKRIVETSGADLGFDRLVVALGAELAPEELPGFADAAHNIYTLDGATSAGRALRDLEGGHVVVLVSRTGFKCPAAPYEAAFLAEATLRRRGLRDRSTIDVYTPEAVPMLTAGLALGKHHEAMLAEHGIGFHPQTVVTRVDGRGGQLVLEDGTRIGYDLLLGVPPHRAPSVVRDSGLAGESGFIPVDRSTLATSAEGVFAIGDATTIPIAGGKVLPKAGVFAHGEAEVVADRIAADLGGAAPDATFDGTGSCFVELGNGHAAYATGEFYPDDGPG
ncbi:MAG: NAD(P)/FAD-dependent oxidoreductase [Acidimicrobiales bacterium]